MRSVRPLLPVAPEPSVGESRVRSWFALLPVTIAGAAHVETRWLETVHVRQEYARFAPCHGAPVAWRNREFVAQPLYLASATQVES